MPEVTIIEATTKRAMTEVVNLRTEGKKALTEMLFPSAQESVQTSEYLQLDQLTGEHGMAPFVEKNGKAIAIGELNGDSMIISCPTINIKRTLTCSDELLLRAAGQPVFVVNGVDVYKEAAEAKIVEDLAALDETINNRVEWMISQLLVGEISYSVEGGASFKVTTAKPAGNTFTVSTLWDAAGATPLLDIKKAKRLVQPYSGPGFQVALCGQNASDAISLLLEQDKVTAIKTESGIAAGLGALIADYQANGMLYLGTFGGIPHFEYAGMYKADGTGTATSFIRADYIEYICTARSDMRSLYYGPIRDMEAIKDGMHITRRFANSDVDKDCGTYIAWLKSRPLPWFKRPDWNVSMKVV